MFLSKTVSNDIYILLFNESLHNIGFAVVACSVTLKCSQTDLSGNRFYLFKLVGWLVVFKVPSTARSFRDGTPIYRPLRRT